MKKLTRKMEKFKVFPTEMHLRSDIIGSLQIRTFLVNLCRLQLNAVGGQGFDVLFSGLNR